MSGTPPARLWLMGQPTEKPRAERMAVRAVRAMLMNTLHLFFVSFVIMSGMNVVVVDFLVDVAVDAED